MTMHGRDYLNAMNPNQIQIKDHLSDTHMDDELTRKYIKFATSSKELFAVFMLCFCPAF
jgi:hypothetical protein